MVEIVSDTLFSPLSERDERNIFRESSQSVPRIFSRTWSFLEFDSVHSRLLAFPTLDGIHFFPQRNVFTGNEREKQMYVCMYEYMYLYEPLNNFSIAMNEIRSSFCNKFLWYKSNSWNADRPLQQVKRHLKWISSTVKPQQMLFC